MWQWSSAFRCDLAPTRMAAQHTPGTVSHRIAALGIHSVAGEWQRCHPAAGATGTTDITAWRNRTPSQSLPGRWHAVEPGRV